MDVGPLNLVVSSPAKINLGLWVTGPREDGYHNLVTLFQKIHLSDLIFIRTSPQGGLRVVCLPYGPQDQENLVYRAIQVLSEKIARSLNLKVRIEKHIPIGAGLGGGSSNAGTVLRVLGTHFGLSEENLLPLARTLGADVPFFVSGWPTAVGTGLGDRLEPVPSLPSYGVLLLVPGLQIATSWAYQRLREARAYTPEEEARERLQKVLMALREGNPRELQQALSNDFERVVFREYPELLELKQRLFDAGAWAALLSGSGSAVFGLFPPEAEVPVLGLEGVRAFRTRFQTGQHEDQTGS